MKDSLLVFEVWRNEELLYISRSSPFVKMYFAPESPAALEQIRTATHWVIYLERPGEKPATEKLPMLKDKRVFPSDWMGLLPDLLRLIDSCDWRRGEGFPIAGVQIPCGQTLAQGESCVEGHLCGRCQHILALEGIVTGIHEKMT